MLCQAAIASGLGGIFTMSASGKQGTHGRVPTGGQNSGGGGGGRGAHFGKVVIAV